MNIQIRPILVALRRHKVGTALIALQIALTLAIVCNALFIIHQRLDNLSEASGVDEANVFVIANQWAGDKSTQQIDAQVRADLVALQQLPGVQAASAASGYPLQGRGWDNLITMTPDQTRPVTDSAVYTGDEHFIDALGLRLIAGRNFRPDEVSMIGDQQTVIPPVVIVSKALADRLFPDGSALGKSFYAMGTTPSTIIGIVDTLHRQGAEQWNKPYEGQSLIWPLLRWDGAVGPNYIVRAKPGQLAEAMREAPKALYAQSRMRIIDPKDGIQDYATIRHKVYDSDRGMAILMGIICAVLLAITAAGIVGLTSFWVGQRRKQIGVRRALGARQRDILAYFLTENFLISAAGVVLGTVLAVAFNLWTVTRFEMDRMSMAYVGAGVIVLLLLGQGATFAPALRASRVSPVEATRSV